MRGSPSESGEANGARSGLPWRSHPAPKMPSQDNWSSWRSAHAPTARRVTSMSSAASPMQSSRTKSTWGSAPHGKGRCGKDVLGPWQRGWEVALAQRCDDLELPASCTRSHPQRDLRHLEPHAAGATSVTGPEEQGEGAGQRAWSQGSFEGGQHLLQRGGHQVPSPPGWDVLQAGVPGNGEIPRCPNVPHTLSSSCHGPAPSDLLPWWKSRWIYTRDKRHVVEKVWLELDFWGTRATTTTRTSEGGGSFKEEVFWPPRGLHQWPGLLCPVQPVLQEVHLPQGMAWWSGPGTRYHLGWVPIKP